MVGLGVAVLAIILRMSARAVLAGGFIFNLGADDICIMVALVLIGGISGCAFIRKHKQESEMAQSMANVPAVADHGLGKDIWTVPFSSITTLLHVRTVSALILTSTDNGFTDLLCQRNPLHHHFASDQGINYLHIPADLSRDIIPMAGIFCHRLEHRLRYRISYRHCLAMPTHFLRLEPVGQGA